MKITVIGMWGGFPKKDGPTSGYLIEHDDVKILLDCGSGVLMKLQEFVNLNEINHVILSHYHEDHACDVGTFMYSRLVNTQLERSKEPLTIYGPNEASKAEIYSSTPSSRFQPIGENVSIKIGPFEIRFLRTVHSVETYAMAIICQGKKFVYTADTSYTEKLIPFAAGADLLLAEASLYEGMDGKAFGHLTGAEAGKLAVEANVAQLVLTHLPHYGDHQELVKSAKAEGMSRVSLAEVNLELEI